MPFRVLSLLGICKLLLIRDMMSLAFGLKSTRIVNLAVSRAD